MTAGAPVEGAAPEPRSEARELLRLAGPLVLSYAGNQGMGFVDTAMVGRLGSHALGGVGIGNGIFFACTLVGMGCVLGMDPLASQAWGAGEHEKAFRIFRQGLRLALLLSLPIMAAMSVALLLLGPLGVDEATAAEARRFLFARLPNAVPFLALSACRSYLQAASYTRPIVIGTVAANVVNFVGNSLLIYGDASLRWLGLEGVGLPALGVVGSGISSTIATAVSFAIAASGVRAIRRPARVSSARASADEPEPALARRILRLGWPVGIQLLAEVGAFTLVAMLAGRVGPQAVAGHQVALTLAALSFTVALGLAAATSVRVGHAVGRGDTPGARRVGFLSMALAAGFMTAAAACFFGAPALLARVLTDQPDVLAAAVPLLRIAAAFQIFDGLQVVAAGALRGAGDTKSVQRANVIGHYAVGLPVAVLLGFGLSMGAPGLWWGLTAGLGFVGLSLSLRFHRVSSRPIRRA